MKANSVAKTKVEVNQNKQQPYQLEPRRPDWTTSGSFLPQREFVQQGYQPQQLEQEEDPRNLLKHTADIIWPIITRRGSLPKEKPLDSKSGIYLGTFKRNTLKKHVSRLFVNIVGF